jgi:hypothetical protein
MSLMLPHQIIARKGLGAGLRPAAVATFADENKP